MSIPPFKNNSHLVIVDFELEYPLFQLELAF